MQRPNGQYYTLKIKIPINLANVNKKEMKRGKSKSKNNKKHTSAPINAHILIPLKSPQITDTIIIKPDIVKIEESKAISRKCDHPGVVGEKESCNG
jgi:hypothetical protein